VLTPVEFDYERFLTAAEVGDEGADRKLTAKLAAFKLPSSESPPQPGLGLGLFMSELPGARVCEGYIAASFAAVGQYPHPNPLPGQGEGTEKAY
jgi:hypothetical protein